MALGNPEVAVVVEGEAEEKKVTPAHKDRQNIY